jgi:putative ATP-binding cassette transporter
MTMTDPASARDRMQPAELIQRGIWRDAGYWLALQARFVAASPLIGGGSLIILIGGIILEYAMVVRMVVATGLLTDALVKHGHVSLNAAVWSLAQAAFLFLLGTLASWFGRYAYQFLWRAHLTTRLMHRWFADDRYYHLEREDALGNPEQRIQEDLYLMGFWTVWLLPFFIGAATSGIYSWILIWNMSFPLLLAPLGIAAVLPKGLAVACLATAVVQVAAAHLAGHRITRYEIIRKRLDADFRHHLTDVREFGEAIAFQRGAPSEEQRALALFERIRGNWWRLTRAQLALSGAYGVFSFLTRLIPPLICIEPILSGQMTIGKLVVATTTFTLAMKLISVVADEYQTIAWLRSAVARIHLLELALAPAVRTGPAATTGSEIGASGLAISLPTGAPLLQVPALAIRQGQHVSIGGRSGSGKSTFLKVLAGLWPYASGNVAMPAGVRTEFLPQRLYLPHDTLAAVLSYPDAPDQFERSRMADALREVGLASLLPELDKQAPWRKRLSPGEQQRLAAARALVRRPDFLIIDEPTSALDPTSEAEIYRALEAGLPKSAILTIAHSRQLIGFHGTQLEVRNGILGAADEAAGIA